MSPLAAEGGIDACKAIEVVIPVFSSVINQKVLLLCDELQDIPCAVLEIRSELNSQGWTGLLTQTAVNAPCKVDPEPGGPASPALTFPGFHGDAAYRTQGRAKIACHTALFSVRVPRKNDPGPGPLGKRPLVFRVFF